MRLLIVAGEASGDKHGANLVRALRAERPDIEWEIFGAGGGDMRDAGVDIIADVRELAIMGVLEVSRAIGEFLHVFRQLRLAARNRRPDLVILIDWPEFNLRLAKKLHRDGHRVVYYISPQIWAWRSYRINAIKRYVERMLVILPFEADYYAYRGVDVDYTGHPLLDSVRVTASSAEFRNRHGLDVSRPVVALLPGSRHSEIKYILPPLLDAAMILSRKRPEIQFLLALAPTIARDELIGELPDSVKPVYGDTYNAVAASDLAAVASGTATLETAIIGTPLIVVYRASALNWRLFRPLINVPYVGLPNLIAERKIVPELLQDEMKGERLAQEITGLLDDPVRLDEQRLALEEVRRRLGEPNASARAARCIIKLLEGI